MTYYQREEDLSTLQRDLDLWEEIILTHNKRELFSNSLNIINFIQKITQNKFEDSKRWEEYHILVYKDKEASVQGIAVFSEELFLHFLISHPTRLIEREEKGSSEIKNVGSSLILKVLQQALRKNHSLTFLIQPNATLFYQKIFGSINERDYNRISLLKIWIAASLLRKKIE